MSALQGDGRSPMWAGGGAARDGSHACTRRAWVPSSLHTHSHFRKFRIFRKKVGVVFHVERLA